MVFAMGPTPGSSTRVVNAEKIGAAAGEVWKALNSSGAVSKAQLSRETGLSPDLTNLAVGWLAREDKLIFEQSRKGEEVLRLKK